jgi:hypothetical protein
MKRELLAAFGAAGAVALVAIGAVATSNYYSGRPDTTPSVSVVPPSTPPGIPVPQRPGYPIERWEKLREATATAPR